MNTFLKSVFISIFPILSLYYVLDSSIHLFNKDIPYRYIGRLIISFTIVTFFISLFVRQVARTDTNLKVFTFPIAIGFLLSIIFGGIIEQDINGALPSVILFLSWVLYIKWYSFFDNRNVNPIIKTGNILPYLKLQDFEKNKVNTSVFFRKSLCFFILSWKLVSFMHSTNTRNCFSI